MNFGQRPADRRLQVAQQIEQVRIVVANVARTVVPQKLVHTRQSVGEVIGAAAIDDIQALAGMRVIQAQARLLRRLRN